MNAKEFVEAFKQLQDDKKIDAEIIIEALKSSFVLAYQTKLCFGNKEATARVDINEATGKIRMYSQKLVVKTDEEVEDIDSQIFVDEAKKIKKSIKVGDILEEEVDITKFDRSIAQYFKQQLQQKLKEAEKKMIFDTFIDKKGEIVTGTIDRIENDYVIIDLGKTNTLLHKKQQLPNEAFYTGEKVQVYISEVNKDKNGTQVLVSRTHPNFIKRLFEQNIGDVYDGTVIIKNIARVPGLRAKVAVTTNEPNVDAVASCIGGGATTINKISTLLNNEKIDVIKYYDEVELFIAEALKPAQVIGLKMDYENKKATAIVINGDIFKAIGKKHSNVVLANRLTGYEITPIDLDAALEQRIAYKSIKDILVSRYSGLVEEIPTSYEDEENMTIPTVAEVQAPTVEEVPVVEEAPKQETKVSEKPKEVYVTKNITAKEDYISVIEEAPKQEETKVEVKDSDAQSKKAAKKEAEALAKAKEEEAKKNYMPIYTEEELKELEAEEDEVDDYEYEEDLEDYEEYYE